MAGEKRGPLTIAELTELWKSVTDPGYSRPFLEQGEGKGFEAHTQGMAIFERASLAIDRTTQSLYVLPHSGQTQEPAGGASKSRVTLRITRSSGFERAVVLAAGFMVEEVEIDFAPGGGIEVATGRRYLLLDRNGFAPGEIGPVFVDAEAEREGIGYDEPQAGSIRGIVQPGSGFSNEGATVTPGVRTHRLAVAPDPDVVIAEHVGQLVELTAGANAGQVRRIVGYEDPVVDTTPPTGGTALLAAEGTYRASSSSGTFLPGEVVEQPLTGGRATVVLARPPYFVFDRLDGVIYTGSPVIGQRSGASATFDSIERAPDMAPELGTAAWRILDWASDLAISVSNDAPPSGGRSAMLDELGSERRVERGSGEKDDDYRQRVAAIADVVSPNALIRTANRILSPMGLQACLREVGLPKLRGLFYDGDPSSPDPAIAFAYDLDFEARPQDRWKVALDYTEFRAFFLMGVPDMGQGDFGCAYDVGQSNAYDCDPFLAFYDGFAASSAAVYRAIWQELWKARAGGVGFDLYRERGRCE